MDLEYDPNNDKQIFQLINPVLINKKGDTTTEKLYYPTIITSDNSEIYSDNSKFTLVFKNSKDSKNKLDSLTDSLSLKVFGISAVEKDQMKIVVDLNKQEILEAPGNGLEWVKPTSGKSTNPESILFRHKITNSLFVGYTTRLSETFTDAKGEVHTRSYNTVSADNVSSLSSGGGEFVNEFRYNFGEKANNYPQPLTITVEKYMNPIMVTEELILLEKVVIK